MSSVATKIFVKDKPLFERLRRLQKADLLRVPVVTVPFCVRSQSAMKRANINTLGDLVIKRRFDLLKMQNLGRRSVTQMEAYLLEVGLSLGTSPDAVREILHAPEKVAESVEAGAASTPDPEGTKTPADPVTVEAVLALAAECRSLTHKAYTLNQKVATLMESMIRGEAWDEGR